MKKNLLIEEHVEVEEDQTPYSDYEILERYCDDKTNILIYHMRIEKDLELGKLYDFTFEDDRDSNTYIYKVLKKNDDGTYFLCEEYNGKMYAARNRIGNPWKICDVEKELGIDLGRMMKLREFLLRCTKICDLVIIEEDGWRIGCTMIDSEDLFIRSLNDKILDKNVESYGYEESPWDWISGDVMVVNI